MRFILSLMLISTLSSKFIGQTIDLPDTVGVGVHELNLTEEVYHTSFTWSIDNDAITPIFNGHTEVVGTGTDGYMFNVVSHSHMIFDTLSGKYYAFVSCASTYNVSPSIQRLDFGSNPNSNPIITDLGNPMGVFISESYSNLESIASAIDDDGVYHMFLTNGGIVHLIFGDGLDNVPTSAERIYDDYEIEMPMQIELMKQDGEYMLFFGNAFGSNRIMRIDIGTDLNNIPSTISHVNLPSYDLPDFPAYFSFFKDGKGWHMIVMLCYVQDEHYRLDFGADLSNNTPTITTIPYYLSTNNRGVNIIKNHEDFYAAYLELNGSFYKGSYDNNILNLPSISALGSPVSTSVSNGFNILEPYWYNDTLWGLTNTWVNSSQPRIFRVPMTTLTGATEVITKYYDPKAEYTFTEPGWHTVTLFCDQGDQAGSEVFRKRVYFDPTKLSINNNYSSLKLSIFPNPSSTEIHVHLSNGSIDNSSKWEITDINGRIILSSSVNKYTIGDDRLTIPISDLPNANYVLSIYNSETQLSKKFVVSK